MAHQTPEEARTRVRAQVTGAALAAPSAGLDPAHWQLHHIALPAGPGNFTPYQAPGCIEEELSPFGEWLEALADVLGPDHAQGIARRGLEAGQ
jgi:hypothetical protein